MQDDIEDLTKLIAAAYGHRDGEDALAYLSERAEIAERSGDYASSVAWRELAIAATKLLRLLQTP